MKQLTFRRFGTVIPRGKALALCLALCALELGFAWSAHGATFTTFDVPGAWWTMPSSINPAGAITGSYLSDVWHGFLRAPDGALTTFDVPGSTSTSAGSINPAGAIIGGYNDVSGGFHGFLRAPDGAFTTFAVPGAPWTLPSSINPAGAIAGYYMSESYH
ncbi:MAG: hypothetical protein HY236_00210, partial [Acidobacteria bacterium]|nr:hypothetical protein [Acidobacteriota bacterium]